MTTHRLLFVSLSILLMSACVEGNESIEEGSPDRSDTEAVQALEGVYCDGWDSMAFVFVPNTPIGESEVNNQGQFLLLSVPLVGATYTDPNEPDVRECYDDPDDTTGRCSYRELVSGVYTAIGSHATNQKTNAQEFSGSLVVRNEQAHKYFDETEKLEIDEENSEVVGLTSKQSFHLENGTLSVTDHKSGETFSYKQAPSLLSCDIYVFPKGTNELSIFLTNE